MPNSLVWVLLTWCGLLSLEVGAVTVVTMADFTPEELTKLGEAFKSLGVKPKMDNPQDLKSWMKDYVKQEGAGEDAAVHVYAQLPRIVVFSGEPKGDQATFDVWKYDVKCLIKEGVHSGPEIYQAARKSLRGEASRIAMRLGPNATIDRLIEKLEGIYGTVEAGENLLAQFYSAYQRPNEDVASWGCRLEDLAQKAVEQGQIPHYSIDGMLHNKFWTGLRQQLKDATRHNFETIADFDNLRVQIRRVEHELNVSRESLEGAIKKEKKTGQVKMASAQSGSPSQETEMKELKAMVHTLSKKVDALQEKHLVGEKAGIVQDVTQCGGQAQNQQNVPVWTPGAAYANPQFPENQNVPFWNNGQGDIYGRQSGLMFGRGGNCHARGNQGRRFISASERGAFPDSGRGRAPLYKNEFQFGTRKDTPSQSQCWRCGQIGHIQYGCRAIVDHLWNPPLN